MLLLTIVGVIVWGMCSAWQASRDSRADASSFWAAFTGPVGDTLGPVLSTLAILVTVFVAVFWQPKQSRAEWELKQEQNRASQVDGWVAESTDGRRFGVVVANDADAVVFNLDLVISREEEKTNPSGEIGLDREFKLPRGTWFIEFIGAERPLHWRAPVPVRESEGMKVMLDPLDGDRVRQPTEHTLRPHVPQSTGGRARPYFVLSEMRYLLHDVAWKRDDRGRPVEVQVLDEAEEARRESAGRLIRWERHELATSSARVDNELESLLRHVIETLCRTGQPDIEDLYAAAIRNELHVDPDVLPGVASLFRPGKGGQIVLNLANPRGSQLKLIPSGGVFPQAVFMRDATDSKFLIGGKKADGVIKKAGARAIGRDNGGDLTSRTTVQWMSTEAEKWKLIRALRSMAVEAGKAQEAPILVPGADDLPDQ